MGNCAGLDGGSGAHTALGFRMERETAMGITCTQYVRSRSSTTARRSFGPWSAACGLLLFACWPGAVLRADEIDLSGTWQLNASCGPGITTVSSTTVVEDVTTGLLTGTTTNCGTL